MLLGSAMLTASWGLSLQGWVIMYTWSLFIFGVGVGGAFSGCRMLAIRRPSRDNQDRPQCALGYLGVQGMLLEGLSCLAYI